MPATVNRRGFLKTAALSASVAVLNLQGESAQPKTNARAELIDVNINLSRWPLRRLRGDDTANLVGRLRIHGISQAWAGNFDALLHKDMAAVNAWLAEECRRHGRGLLVPAGSVNPKLPDWEQDLRRCAEDHRMTAIRLYPNYHGYQLDDPDFIGLLRLASDRRLIVQLAMLMEDERMMHPLMRVPVVDIAPLAGVLRDIPEARLVLLNASARCTASCCAS